MNSQDISKEEAYLAQLSRATGISVEALQEQFEKLTPETGNVVDGMSNLRYALAGEDGNYQKATLLGLNKLHKHVYSGTVDADEIARRRKANKVARVSRRKNRK